MKEPALDQLSKRERQIVDVIYRSERSGVGDVRKSIPNAPSYSAIRTTLNILVRKGFLERIRSGRKYLYAPTMTQEKAGKQAVRRLLQTYFNNSIELAVSGLLSVDDQKLTPQEYGRLIALIRKAKNEERHR
jgi:BlaI family penicillinase repressor